MSAPDLSYPKLVTAVAATGGTLRQGYGPRRAEGLVLVGVGPVAVAAWHRFCATHGVTRVRVTRDTGLEQGQREYRIAPEGIDLAGQPGPPLRGPTQLGLEL